MKNNYKLTKEEFDSLYDKNITVYKYDEIISKIDERFEYICDKFLIKNYKNGNSPWYDYSNIDITRYDSEGYFDTAGYKEKIFIRGENIDYPDGYYKSFPTRWLWEDFEEELKETIDKAKKKEQKEKQKRKTYVEERKKKIEILKESIRQKLTPEEFKILKFKK